MMQPFKCIRCDEAFENVVSRNAHQLECRGSAPAGKKKTKSTGDQFEALVKASCDLLRHEGLHVRHHGPQFRGQVGRGGLATGRMVSKGGLDYEGSFLTRWCAFEAKSTKGVSLALDWKSVKPHQVEAVKDAWERGDVAFFLVEFSEKSLYFAMAWDTFRPWWDGYQGGGRASIPLTAFQDTAIPVRLAGKHLDIIWAIKAVAARVDERSAA